MISQVLFKWLQHTLHGADPEKLRSWVYLIQIGAGAVIILGVFLFKQREAPSGFRVREADLKSKPVLGNNPGKNSDNSLAQARYAKKAEPLRLGGISIQGKPHEILGVRPDASEALIRTAYRELMKRYHPDQVGRPGSREWKDAQIIAEAINGAKEKMLAALKSK